jgi:predicted DNA-binding transcriptional regulator AlpA
MNHGKQARIQLRTKMLRQGLTFTELARRVGHPRPTVSKAVNHGHFPRVLAKVEAHLNGN